MKKSFILTLVCIAAVALESVPSWSIFALADTNTQRQDAFIQTSGSQSLAIASFNIQFLGSSTKRDDPALAMILRDFDIVVVQELVAPPFDGKFPDGSAYKPDTEAAEFFNAMTVMGFEYILSSEDTGTGPTNHNNGSATEWWVVFYKSNKVKPADGLPTDFLADDRTDHEHYERVPYAFAFRSPEGHLDFVLISVHLMPGSSGKARREEELKAISDWVDGHDEKEKDFIILGDMNIEDCEELQEVKPADFLSLNDECEATNTNVNGPKPYDHVMYRPAFTTGKEIDKKFDFRVFNLIEAMRPFWNSTNPYPGGAINPISLPEYNHDDFRAFYSDHHPVVFKLTIPAADDD